MPESKPKKKYLQLKPEDQLKADIRQAARDAKPKITDEHMAIAEFGLYYGFYGVEKVLNDEIDLDTFVWLLNAARKVRTRDKEFLADIAVASQAAVKSKTVLTSYKRLQGNLARESRADV